MNFLHTSMLCHGTGYEISVPILLLLHCEKTIALSVKILGHEWCSQLSRFTPHRELVSDDFKSVLPLILPTHWSFESGGDRSLNINRFELY